MVFSLLLDINQPYDEGKKIFKNFTGNPAGISQSLCVKAFAMRAKKKTPTKRQVGKFSLEYDKIQVFLAKKSLPNWIFNARQIFLDTFKNMIFFLLSKCLVWIPISLDRKILACPKLKIQFDNDFLLKTTWIPSYFEENLENWCLGWDWTYQNKALLW